MDQDHIIGWQALADLCGIHVAALQMRQTKGKLPFTRKWVEGRRAFDLAEVRAWLDNETTRKKEH